MYENMLEVLRLRIFYAKCPIKFANEYKYRIADP